MLLFFFCQLTYRKIHSEPIEKPFNINRSSIKLYSLNFQRPEVPNYHGPFHCRKGGPQNAMTCHDHIEFAIACIKFVPTVSIWFGLDMVQLLNNNELRDVRVPYAVIAAAAMGSSTGIAVVAVRKEDNMLFIWKNKS